MEHAAYVISPNIIDSHLPNVVNISETSKLKHIRPSGNCKAILGLDFFLLDIWLILSRDLYISKL